MLIKSKAVTTPEDDTVSMEGRDTFSAWPILFNNKKDSGGLLFDRKSELQPPFDDLYIIFRFYVANSPEPGAPYRATDVHIATVLSWRLTALGLWIRGGFSEPPEEESPYSKILTQLKAEIKRKRIGMTYSTLRSPELLDISPEGRVHKLPLVAFNLYERESDV